MSDATVHAAPTPMPTLALWLMAGTALCFVAAGALLWLHEGEKLFTDGLVAAMLRCF